MAYLIPPVFKWGGFIPLLLLAISPAALCSQTAAPDSYAQVLIDGLMRADPDLVRCDLYAAAPGAQASRAYNIASTRPQKIGAHAGAEVLSVLAGGNQIFRQTADKALFEGTLVLQDKYDRPVGALVMAYKYLTPDDENMQFRYLVQLCNELKLKIPDHAALFGPAREPGKLYGQILMDRIMAARPDMVRCGIHATPKGTPIRYNLNIAYADVMPLRRLGSYADQEEDFRVLTTGESIFYFIDVTPFNSEALYKAVMPLQDRSGQQVGVILFGFRYTNKNDEAKFREDAIALRNRLKIFIPEKMELFKEAVPGSWIYAQSLVDRITATHPEVVKCEMHVTAPDAPESSTYDIAANDPARVGQLATETDFKVITLGEPIWQRTSGPDLYEGKLPLFDREERQVGAITLAVKCTREADEAGFARTMSMIRDGLKLQIKDATELFNLE